MQENWNNSEGQPLNGADGEVERALSSLRPAQPNINRDRLLFSAGARSAQSRLWLWRGTTGSLAAMLLVSIFIRPQMPAGAPTRDGGSAGILAKTKPADQPVERVRTGWSDVIYMVGNPAAEPPPSDNYLAVRQSVLRNDLRALPAPAGGRTQDTQQRLFDLRMQDPNDPNFGNKRPGGEAL